MEPFIAEIKMFGGNFAPRGYALCDGQLLPISQNQALFSLIGTIYGGDGRTTFALPDLRGRVPVHQGTGPGMSPRQIGQKFGSETNTLNQSQLPSHNHGATGTFNGSGTLQVFNGAGDNDSASGHSLANAESDLYTTNAPNASMSPDNVEVSGSVSVQVGATGNNVPVNNMQPSLTINFIIALTGTFPSRN